MSSQAVRNKVNTKIRRIISDVKKKVIAEGKKKVMELKDQLLSPETIIRILSADINQDSCSVEGRSKMEEKVRQLNEQLDNIDGIAQEGLKVLNGLEDKIGSISSKAKLEMPAPPTIPSPIEGIQKITDAIKPLTEIMQYVIWVSPAILSASSGPAASGAVIAGTNNKVNLAKAKIAEFTNLFTALPRLLDKYIGMADIVFDNITKIKSKIQAIVNELDKLRAFIIYLEMDFMDKCNELQLPEVPPDLDPPIINQDPPPLTLEDIIAQAEELYGNILEDLIAQGQSKAIKRVYAVGAQIQRIKNTRVEVIRFGTDPNSTTSEPIQG